MVHSYGWMMGGYYDEEGVLCLVRCSTSDSTITLCRTYKLWVPMISGLGRLPRLRITYTSLKPKKPLLPLMVSLKTKVCPLEDKQDLNCVEWQTYIPQEQMDTLFP